MAKKKPSKSRPEILNRSVAITTIHLGVSLRPSSDRDREPDFEDHARIELSGKMDDPIREVRDVEITLYSTTADRAKVGTNPMPWIGLVHGVRPVMRPTVFVPEAAFDRLWVLAGTGAAKYAHMTLTKPRYQSAYVIGLSLSTQAEE